MRRFSALSLMVASMVFVAAPQAFAADAIAVPWGDWLAGALQYFHEILATLIVALVSMAMRGLPAQVRDIVLAMRVEQIIARALDYGIGAVSNAVKGRTLDVRTANAVLNAGADYVVANAPALAGKLGETLRPKILARMSAAGILPPDSTADIMGAALPPRA